MKTKDIELYGEYAWRKAGYASPRRVLVIKKGVYRRIWPSGSFSPVRSVRPDGIIVVFLKEDGTPYLSEDGGRPWCDVFLPRQFVRTWAEQEKINEEHAAGVKAATESAKARFEELAEMADMVNEWLEGENPITVKLTERGDRLATRLDVKLGWRSAEDVLRLLAKAVEGCVQ